VSTTNPVAALPFNPTVAYIVSESADCLYIVSAISLSYSFEKLIFAALLC